MPMDSDMMDMPLGDEMAPPMGDPMDEPMGEPMDASMNEPTGNEDDELINLIDKLSIEDKAAVTKYAKSMVDDNDGTDGGDVEEPMPMESKKTLTNIIDEALNDIISDTRGTKRPEKKLPKAYREKQTPFKSPY